MQHNIGHDFAMRQMSKELPWWNTAGCGSQTKRTNPWKYGTALCEKEEWNKKDYASEMNHGLTLFNELFWFSMPSEFSLHKGTCRWTCTQERTQALRL